MSTTRRVTALTAVVALAIFAAPVLAKEGSSTNSNEAREKVEVKKTELKTMVDEKRAELETKRAELQDAVETKKTEVRTTLDGRKEEVKSRIETKQGEVRTMVEEKKDAAQERVEQNTEERKQLRDQAAQEHAAKLNTRFQTYSQRFDNIISRLEKKATELSAKNKNTTEIQAKIAAAKEKLEAAKLNADEATAAFIHVQPVEWEKQKPDIEMGQAKARMAREDFLSVTAHLKEATQALKEVVQQ